MEIKTLGVIFKDDDPEVVRFTREVVNFLRNKGFKVYIGKPLTNVIEEHLETKSFKNLKLDAIVVIGGDGTVLKAFHTTRKDIPLIPVNSDSLGFFHDLDRSNYQKAFDLIQKAEYLIQSWRTGCMKKGKEEIANFVNEVVFYNINRGKMFVFKLYKDGELITGGRCDGIIISTALGSTAYSLSQGGPIVDINLDSLVFTPISPFTPFLKPMIFTPGSFLEIQVFVDSLALIDGFLYHKIGKNEKISVSLSGRKISFIKIRKLAKSYFTRLRKRLLDEPFTLRFF